jgi:hypothetical protein
VRVGWRSTTAAIPLSWTRSGRVPRNGARPRRVCDRWPASTCDDAVHAGELPRGQAIYAELEPLLEFSVAGGLAATVTAGLELWDAGVGDPRRPLLPLDDEGRDALKKLLTHAWQQH